MNADHEKKVEAAFRRGETIWWEWNNNNSGAYGGIVGELASGLDWSDKMFFTTYNEAMNYRLLRAKA